MLTLTYNHYIQNKIKNRLPKKARNYACFKLEKKPLEVLKRIEKIIDVKGGKFATNIK